MATPRNYTNGELGILLEGVKESLVDLKEGNVKAHEEIKTAQAYTNGTVKKHEKVIAYLKGAWAVVSILLIGLIIPLTVNYFQSQSTVEKQVDKALSKYLEVQ